MRQSAVWWIPKLIGFPGEAESSFLWEQARNNFLASEFEAGRFTIRTGDVLGYFATLESGQARQIVEWSESTRQLVAAGLLRIAADFGLLRGSTVKHFASYQLPDESFLYLLHAIAESEPNARKIVESPEWRLYLMGHSDVEQALFRLHQFRPVHYEVAGSLAQLQLPCASSVEYVRRICA